MFSIVAATIYIPTKSVGGFFPILSSALGVYSLFIDGHYDQCELVLDCNFDLHLSNKAEHLFMCILIIYVF